MLRNTPVGTAREWKSLHGLVNSSLPQGPPVAGEQSSASNELVVLAQPGAAVCAGGCTRGRRDTLFASLLGIVCQFWLTAH